MINSLKYNDKYIVFFNFEKNTTNVNFYMHTCNQFEKKLSCKIKMYIYPNLQKQQEKINNSHALFFLFYIHLLTAYAI
jgi:hypothetical protein